MKRIRKKFVALALLLACGPALPVLAEAVPPTVLVAGLQASSVVEPALPESVESQDDTVFEDAELGDDAESDDTQVVSDDAQEHEDAAPPQELMDESLATSAVPQSGLPVAITEVLPDPAAPQTDAADEFVELFNPNDHPVELTGYKLVTGVTAQHIVVVPDSTIAAKGYLLVKSSDTKLSLVNTGTPVQLTDKSDVVIAEVPNYHKALPGKSFMPQGTDWLWTATPTPGVANILTPVSGASSQPAAEQTASATDEVSAPSTYLPVHITELLPDPASPGQDANDEFIELFNPNSVSVNLKNYQLQSGSAYRYHFTLPDVTIEPGQYYVIMSEESGLSLSNTGTSVRVLDPNLAVIDEVANYGKATEGQSWAQDANGIWQWSTTVTSGAANLLTVPTKIVKAVAKKTTTKKATSTAKPKVASATKTKASDTSGDTGAPTEPAGPSPNYWLLAGVGSLVVGYGVYEYRQGIAQGARRLWQFARGKQPES